MKYFSYILYSKQLDRFYIGSTSLEVSQRLDHHLSDYYGNTKFTHKAKDWEVFLFIECKSIQQARSIEKHIKKMKSKKYIENLSNYPEMIQSLIDKF